MFQIVSIDKLKHWQVNIILDIRKYINLYPVLPGDDGQILKLLDIAYDNRPKLSDIEILQHPQVDKAIYKFKLFCEKRALCCIVEGRNNMTNENPIESLTDKDREYLELLLYDIGEYEKCLSILFKKLVKTQKLIKYVYSIKEDI